jgi:ATP phosphoribosyltransferase regulatory subunit
MAMKPARSLIPIGTATLLPGTARNVRRLEERLMAYVAKWGYQEIILPTFEYLDVLSVGLAPEILEKCYKFADWASGRILVLRPDATAQIARMVAMGFGGKALPLRYAYRTTVFRYEPEHRGRDREIFQIGLEFLGADTPDSDAEMVTVLIEVLNQIGLPSCKISLGHVGFLKGLLTRSGLSAAGRKQAELAVARKDLPLLEEILVGEGVPHRKVGAILEVPERCGGYEVVKWGKRIAGKDRVLLEPLVRLEQVYRLLERKGVHEKVVLDLGEFRGFDYYDGVVFDVFTGTMGSEIGGGGRYNHLIGRFGRDLPAIGFALDIARMFSALDRQGTFLNNGFSTVTVFAPPHLRYASFELSQSLRQAGVSVVEEGIPEDSRNAVAQVHRYVRQRGLSRGVLLAGKRLPQQVWLFECAEASRDTRQIRLTIPELIQHLKSLNDGHF